MHDRINEILRSSGCPYKEYLHNSLGVAIHGPQDFAFALGYEQNRITKTLLVRATNQDLFGLVVAPSNRRIDLGRVAQILQVKHVQIASTQELSQVLGYPPKGVSPLGADSVPVLIDESLMGYESILIGAGEIGVEIEISPKALKKLTNAMPLDLT